MKSIESIVERRCEEYSNRTKELESLLSESEIELADCRRQLKIAKETLLYITKEF